ncbi:DsbA family protein [Pseudoponticoccus marisrubri]|uniref:Thiol-disulfide oxidoreductase n=1 Tax=Pseudoponticoccus marisrubri TaxID=1685382 RepID=A0A0W7WK68_9RHOB|nr:DsbA family protein [Pseudoponticoccus marisrubri]KUF10994.1 thiol-disulfide oxidoreductase [Pseudoponticoccus marisrubri]
MNRMLPAGALALALIGGGAWYVTQGSGAANVSQAPLPGAAQAQQAADVDTSGITEMTLGDAEAPVEVIEYASFTCPHCATFHTEVFKDLKEDYVDTGKVSFTYREVYFDKYGMWASLIARCAGEDRFFGIVDLIYKGQSTWSRAGSDAAIADELRKIGRLAGMENDQIDACLTDGDKLQTLVAWYQQNATEHGIQSTPSFVIDGETYSNMSYADFSAILDERLGE